MSPSCPMTAPRRRLSFRLRTLFVVVTVAGCWLGWQIHIVRERRGVLNHLRGGVGIVQISVSGTRSEVNIPFWRSWLGDEPIACLILPAKTFSRDDLRRVRSLFPEADVGRAHVDETNWYLSVPIDD